MKKEILLLLFCISIFTNQSAAQESTDPLKVNVIPPAPEAASLGKYIEMPVNTYTGLPKVEVPIYTLKSYNLELPIYLSYHASGLKVEEIASSVGAGWALNAGGVVSRTIRGLNDEHDQGYFSTGKLNGRFWVPPFFNGNALDDDYIFNNTDPNCDGDGNDAYDNIYYASRGGLDLEPDMFFFTLPDGQAGKFVYDRAKNINLIPKQYADINYSLDGQGKPFNTWEIYGRDGTKYYFDIAETTLAQNTCREPDVEPHPESPQPGELPQVDAPSTWKLTKIVSANELDSILFEYENETISYTQSVAVTDYDRISGLSGDVPSSACLNYITTYGKRLKKITGSNGYSVEFKYNNEREDLDGASELNKIEVFYKTELIKYFILGHSYASSGGAHYEKYLMLDDITEYNDQNQAIPSYTFEYYPSMPFFSRRSKSVDHWGYYNGAENNQLKAPAMIHDGRYYSGADREANLLACYQGSLKKITYPTGGETLFTYDLHDYSNLPVQSQYPFSPGLESLATIEFNITADEQVDYAETQQFSLAEDTDVIFMYEIPEIYGGGIPAGGNSGTLVNASSTFSLDFVVSGPSNPQVETLEAGDYMLDAVFDPSMFNWPPEHPLDEQEFYIKIFKVKALSDLIEEGKLKGGGLRIEKITQRGVNDYVKTYEYKEVDGQTSGKIMSFPYYAYTQQINDDSWDPQSSTCTVNGSGQFLVRSSVSNMPLTNSQGSHVGYDRVVEYVGTSLVNNGYTIFEYFNQTDDLNHQPAYPFPFVPTKSYGYKNGLLKQKEVYTSSGEVVQKIRHGYSFTSLEEVGLGIKIAENKRTNCLQCPNREFVYQSYKQPTALVRLTSTVEETYDMDFGGHVTRDTYFEYDSYDQVTKKTTSTSEANRTMVTESDYHGVDHTRVEEFRQYYTIETSPSVYEYEMISGKRTVFDAEILPQEVYLAESDDQLLTGLGAFSGLYQKRLTFHNYGPVGNLQAFSKEGDVMSSFIWGYDQMYPVAQVIGGSANEVAYTSFENDPPDGNWVYNGTGNRSVDPGAKTGSYLFNNASGTFSRTSLNTSQDYVVACWVKGTNNITINGTSYSGSTDWKYIQMTVPSSATVNVQFSGHDIDELRLYPVGAKITTYTYDPVVGITSSTDTNGITTSYHYDAFNRLEYVKDHEGNILSKNEYHYALQN